MESIFEAVKSMTVSQFSEFCELLYDIGCEDGEWTRYRADEISSMPEIQEFLTKMQSNV